LGEEVDLWATKVYFRQYLTLFLISTVAVGMITHVYGRSRYESLLLVATTNVCVAIDTASRWNGWKCQRHATGRCSSHCGVLFLMVSIIGDTLTLSVLFLCGKK
jgi:hypothetical protein